jgi:hypothetical protein
LPFAANAGMALATIIAATTDATANNNKMRLMYPPNVVAIPAGSPNQHRKGLSDDAGRTDEQNLALTEQDPALFEDFCVNPAFMAASFSFGTPDPHRKAPPKRGRKYDANSAFYATQ